MSMAKITSSGVFSTVSFVLIDSELPHSIYQPKSRRNYIFWTDIFIYENNISTYTYDYLSIQECEIQFPNWYIHLRDGSDLLTSLIVGITCTVEGRGSSELERVSTFHHKLVSNFYSKLCQNNEKSKTYQGQRRQKYRPQSPSSSNL